MSVEALAIALHHSRARGTAKLVLLGIANHQGDGGAWPTVPTLARYANVDDRTVQRALGELVALGEIDRQLQLGGTLTSHKRDSDRPNRYDVLIACPAWCDRTMQHRVAEGWERLDDGSVQRCPQDNSPSSTDNAEPGDMPDSDQSDPVTLASPGDTGVTGGVTLASPKPSLEPNTPVAKSVEQKSRPRARDVPEQLDRESALALARASLRDAVTSSTRSVDPADVVDDETTRAALPPPTVQHVVGLIAHGRIADAHLVDDDDGPTSCCAADVGFGRCDDDGPTS